VVIKQDLKGGDKVDMKNIDMKSAVFWALVRTDISEGRITSIVKMIRIGGMCLRNVCSYNSPHGIISQKTAFFIVTAVRTSNLTGLIWL
jgi:hypothetical protein